MFDNNREDDEITYKTTEFLSDNSDEFEVKEKKHSFFLLLFFIFVSLIAIGALLYVFMTKSNEIKSLNIKLSEEMKRNKLDRAELERLERKLSESDVYINSLTTKGKESREELSRLQTALSKSESEKKDRGEKISELQSKVGSLENSFTALDVEMKKSQNERKKAEDDLKGAGERIAALEKETQRLKDEISYWQKKYDKLMKEQTDAVNAILSSAKQRQKAVDYIEQELLKAYEKSELYYSLIGWEENYRLTNRVPLSKVTQKPLLLTTAKADYPASAESGRIEGMAILKGVLGEDGKMANIEVLYSPQNNTALAAAAKEAVSKYRYRQAQRDGHNVKVVLVIPVDFSLKE